MNKIYIAIIALLASAALFVSSCSGCSKAVDITGVWDLSKIDGATVVIPEDMPSIEFFSNKQYSLNTGINIVNGKYSLKKDILKMSQGPMTRMAGSEEGMNLETQILNFVFDSHTISVEGDVLTLSSSNGNSMQFSRH